MKRPIRRILVAVKDVDAKSLPAVVKAAQIAKTLDAQIELYHAIDNALYVDQISLEGETVGQVERQFRDRYLGKLNTIAARVGRHGVRVTTAVEWDFPVHEAIVRRAARIKADLIVAERHARRHVAPWILHFTDWELLRLAPVPVLLVKTPQPYRNPVVLTALDPGHANAKPAKLDEAILRQGQTACTALHGKLHAMHAYLPLPPELIAGFNAAMIAASDVGRRIEAETAARANTAFERVARAAKLPPARRHVVIGDPIYAIPNAARETQAAIVVMGAVSRSGLKRVFIGNTAERVLDRLACDVLIVKPPRFVNHVQRGRRGARLTVAAAPLYPPLY